MKKKLLMALLVGVLAVPSSVSCFAAESTDAAAADSDEEEETEETEAEDKDTTAKKKENLKTVGEKKDGCIAFKLRNATSKKIIGLAIKTADETEFTENMMEEDDSFELKEKKRIVIKIGSSSLTHPETGDLNLRKIEQLVRVLSDLRGQGREVILVSSGAIAAGRQALGFNERPRLLEEKQAFAAVGQARLMMVYQKLFAEYNQTAAQILMTKNTVTNPQSRFNAHNTFNELLKLGTIPIVNENDTVATDEIQFGDNDRLSAIVAALVEADILILMSDIDGLYTDDPNKNPDAAFIPLVRELTPELQAMGKGASSSVGTGGMSAKLAAAQIATGSGSDMLIANACDLNVIYRILEGEECGTLFTAHENKDFDLNTYLNSES